MAQSKNMFAAPPKVKPDAERFLVSAEVAAPKFGVSAKHLRNQANAGLVPHVKIGERILFNLDRLKQFCGEQMDASVRQQA